MSRSSRDGRPDRSNRRIIYSGAICARAGWGPAIGDPDVSRSLPICCGKGAGSLERELKSRASNVNVKAQISNPKPQTSSTKRQASGLDLRASISLPLNSRGCRPTRARGLRTVSGATRKIGEKVLTDSHFFSWLKGIAIALTRTRHCTCARRVGNSVGVGKRRAPDDGFQVGK